MPPSTSAEFVDTSGNLCTIQIARGCRFLKTRAAVAEVLAALPSDAHDFEIRPAPMNAPFNSSLLVFRTEQLPEGAYSPTARSAIFIQPVDR